MVPAKENIYLSYPFLSVYLPKYSNLIGPCFFPIYPHIWNSHTPPTAPPTTAKELPARRRRVQKKWHRKRCILPAELSPEATADLSQTEFRHWLAAVLAETRPLFQGSG